MHLGVDTDFFFPVHSETTAHQRAVVRVQLGISPSGYLCIYTGKLTVENALILFRRLNGSG